MPEPIRSRTNPLFKRLRALKARAAQDGPCLLEGGKLVVEALGAGVKVIEVAAAPRAALTGHGRAALEAAEAARVPVRWLDDPLMDDLSDAESGQGLLGLAQRPRFAPEAIYEPAPALVVVAVEVQNPANLGGLLRTAEAAGATGAVLTRGCADAFSWKALRGSMGSAFRLPQWPGAPPTEAIDALRARGLRIAAADAAGTVDCWDADLRAPVALLVGNEARGLDAALVRSADLRLRVPLRAPVESLNVGVAAGVLLFEAARQRRRRRV